MVDRREPRHWLVHPTVFGKPGRSGIEWVPAPKSDADLVDYRAAQIQHAVSARVAVLMAAKGYSSLRDLRSGRSSIPEVQMSYDRMIKVLRGQAPMTLRHVADLERRLGPLLVDLQVDLPPWSRAPRGAG